MLILNIDVFSRVSYLFFRKSENKHENPNFALAGHHHHFVASDDDVSSTSLTMLLLE